ncbi:MAG: hypothetical protein JWP12_2667 [Bacteroidetes bacterium]|nr:hypothetical protein [Bacteroidota bacterium]
MYYLKQALSIKIVIILVQITNRNEITNPNVIY